MKPEPDPAPADTSHWPSEAEFRARMESDPEFQGFFWSLMEQALALPATPELAPLQQAAREGLAARRHEETAITMQQKLRGFDAYLEAALAGKAELDFAKIDRLLEEAGDVMLDLREPERTRHLAALQRIRETMRQIGRDLPG